MSDGDDFDAHAAELLRAARRSVSPPLRLRDSVDAEGSSAGGLEVLASEAEFARRRRDEDRRTTFGLGRGEVTPDGRADRDSEDDEDLAILRTYAEFLPPDAVRALKGMTNALILHRRLNQLDMVAVFKTSIATLLRDNKPGAGAPVNRTGQPPEMGSTFSADTARATDLSASFAAHVEQSVLLATGLPAVTLNSTPEQVFGFVEDLLNQLKLVLPYGPVLASAIVQSLPMDQVPYVCGLAVQKKGTVSPYAQAAELLLLCAGCGASGACF